MEKEMMFTELRADEMENVDGGSGLVVGVVVGVLVEAASKSITGKGLSDWVAEGVNYLAGQLVQAFN